MTEQLGLRERKKLQTRHRIETAAFDHFAMDGFDGTTIETIAASADISPRTFFYYFPTKEDVVLADYASRLDRIVEQLSERPATEGPWDALRASILVVAADYDNERDRLIRRFQIMATTPSVYARSLQLQSGWEDALASVLAQRMGCDAENLGPRVLAASALGALRASQRHWIASGQRAPLPSLVEDCFDQLATGLAAIG